MTTLRRRRPAGGRARAAPPRTRRARRAEGRAGAASRPASAPTAAPRPRRPPKPPRPPALEPPPPRRRSSALAARLARRRARSRALAYKHFHHSDPPPPVVVRTITVTIPEGYTRAQTAGRSPSRKACAAATRRRACSSKYLNPAKYGGKDAKDLEGFLFPDTFELKKHARPPTWSSCSSRTSSGGSTAST